MDQIRRVGIVVQDRLVLIALKDRIHIVVRVWIEQEILMMAFVRLSLKRTQPTYRACKAGWKWLVIIKYVLVVHQLSHIVRLVALILKPKRYPVLVVAFLQELRISA